MVEEVLVPEEEQLLEQVPIPTEEPPIHIYVAVLLVLLLVLLWVLVEDHTHHTVGG